LGKLKDYDNKKRDLESFTMQLKEENNKFKKEKYKLDEKTKEINKIKNDLDKD
jgi:hypothetical protein